MNERLSVDKRRYRPRNYLVLGTVVGLALLTMSCQNPFDFQPDDDELEPPPAPPALLQPPDDTVFYYDIDEPYPHDIVLEWQYLQGAQYYEIEVSFDSLFPGATKERIYGASYRYQVENNGVYYWHVRAYSPRWTWYTAFSVTWHFKTVYSPAD